MTAELLAVASIAIATAIYLFVASPTRGSTAVILMGMAFLGFWRWTAWQSLSLTGHDQREEVARQAPAKSNEDGYASSSACRSCHPSNYDSWHRSYHRTMTQIASRPALLADVGGVQVSDGIDYQLQWRGEELWSRQWPGGGSADQSPFPDAQLVMTTGSHHYQIYWAARGTDRTLSAFPLAYLREAQRWIPREAALLIPPGQSQALVIWNADCIRCHSTHGEPRVNMEAGTSDSQAAELGIACESCHGPGDAHVTANRNPVRRYALHLTGAGDPTIVQPEHLSAERSSQVCGQCHSVSTYARRDWSRGAWNAFRPGSDLAQVQTVVRPNRPESLKDIQAALEQDPQFLRGRFWSDGMVRVAGRELNGLIESPCYRGGKFSCLSCHSMHESDPDDQLAAGMETDKACLQCHAPFAANITGHTHHASASEGSRCYNCHMPHTTGGLLKATRSHQINSPTVAASLETGRPNACNQCHLDKTLLWTQEHLRSWYGTAPVDLTEDQREVSATVAWLLQGDAGQRALAAWSMGWRPARQVSGEDWLAPYLAILLDDPYAAVRYMAQRSLRSSPGFSELNYDFLGAGEQRAGVRRQIVTAWQAERAARPGRTGRDILIDAGGRLDVAALERLLKRRDDRPVFLQE